MILFGAELFVLCPLQPGIPASAHQPLPNRVSTCVLSPKVLCPESQRGFPIDLGKLPTSPRPRQQMVRLSGHSKPAELRVNSWALQSKQTSRKWPWEPTPGLQGAESPPAGNQWPQKCQENTTPRVGAEPWSPVVPWLNAPPLPSLLGTPCPGSKTTGASSWRG